MGQLVFQATLGGQVNLVGPNTASTFNINVPAVAGNMVTTGDTGTVTNTMLAGSIANAKLTNSSVTIGSTNVALGATAATVAGLALTTPDIGTPSAGTLTNCTGLPAATGLSGIVAQANGGTGTTTGYYGFKNRIINGAMMIDQRNAGASVTGNNGAFAVDRWKVGATQSSKFTIQQSTTAPAGYKNSYLVTSSSSYSVTSTDEFEFIQFIEGNNVADLGWGTANAQAVTLSFVVRSSLTGTFGGVLYNNATNRCYIFSYTINSANTFETKSVTIAGDTSGTWETGTSTGIAVLFCIGAGSTLLSSAGSWGSTFYRGPTGQTSIVGTSGATFYITGVQLEKGSTATSFDYRPYGTELSLCQRYYQTWGGNSGNERIGCGFNYSTTQCRIDMPLVVTMRSAPTLTVSAAADWVVETTSSTPACTSIALDQPSTKIAACNFNVASGLTAGQGAHIIGNGSGASRFNLSSEL